MKIGSANWSWDVCEKCIHFDDEYGCKKLDDLTLTVEEEDIVCLTGEES
jgi:hypothetical protein